MLRRILIPALAAFLITTPAFAQRGHFDGDRQRGSGFPGSQFDLPRGEDNEQRRERSLTQILRELERRYGGELQRSRREGDYYVITWKTMDGRVITVRESVYN